ncbi:MAG: N-acetyltransferase family protein [Cyanobacteria bacterium P01_E01_bin.6]
MQRPIPVETNQRIQIHQSNVMIRPAEPRDFQAIADIYNEAIAHGGMTMDGRLYTANDIQAMVQKMSSREIILVADIEQEPEANIIGWGIVKQYSDRLGYQVCCETSIYLTFSQRGKGYGRHLQTALMKQVEQFKYHHIVAKIVASNQSSIRFHQQFGFELVGIQKEIGQMQGTWYDIAIMQCILPDIITSIP